VAITYIELFPSHSACFRDL